MDSWNARYTGQEVYCDRTGESGYKVRSGKDSATTAIRLNQNENNGGELYFANNYSSLTDGNNTVDSYWIASPSAGGTATVISVGCDRLLMSYDGFYNNNLGLRPVVCLQSNISLK